VVRESDTACEAQRPIGHRDTESQRKAKILCVSVSLWRISPRLAARGFRHGLRGGFEQEVWNARKIWMAGRPW